jgi:hypothetical protein
MKASDGASSTLRCSCAHASGMEPITFAVPFPSDPMQGAVAGLVVAAGCLVVGWLVLGRPSRRTPPTPTEMIAAEQAKLTRAGYRSLRWCITLAPLALAGTLAALLYLTLTSPVAIGGAISALGGAAGASRLVRHWTHAAR